MHLTLIYGNELINFDRLQKEVKNKIKLVFLLQEATEIVLSQTTFLICVCVDCDH